MGEHAGRVVSTRAYRCGGTQSLCAVVLGRGCETCLTVANSAREAAEIDASLRLEGRHRRRLDENMAVVIGRNAA